MKTKIVYVLVSQESDYYYEMLLLSHYSLRLYHSKDDAEVVLVMDTDTHNRLVNKKAPILNDVTPLVVNIPEEYTVMQRSRYLKTSLRQIVNGNFLYLDCDTLVCEALDELDKVEADVAMVSDVNNTIALTDSVTIEHCSQAGFPHLRGKPYYNGGVMYAKDSPSTDAFFVIWNQFWLSSVQRGVSQDQPALCQANSEMDNLIQELSGVWNCQILFPSSGKYLKKAKILHYYTGMDTLFRKMVMDQIKDVGHISIPIGQIALKPRTLGCSVFTINNKRGIDYLFSDFLYVYDNTPRLYQLILVLSKVFEKPLRVISKAKGLFSK